MKIEKSKPVEQSGLHIHKYTPVILQAIIYLFTLILFKVFCRLEVRGYENLRDTEGALIFAPNHSSEWDGILMRVVLPFFSMRFSPMYYVSMVKEEYVNSGWRKHIYGGLLFELLGAYPRYRGRRDYSHSLQNFVKILELGRNVCIFPEGKRTENGTIGEAHGGVAFLAYQTKAPVIPVGISGLVNLKMSDLFLMRRKVIINIGKPYKVGEIKDPEDYKREASEVMEGVELLRI